MLGTSHRQKILLLSFQFCSSPMLTTICVVSWRAAIASELSIKVIFPKSGWQVWLNTLVYDDSDSLSFKTINTHSQGKNGNLTDMKNSQNLRPFKISNIFKRNHRRQSWPLSCPSNIFVTWCMTVANVKLSVNSASRVNSKIWEGGLPSILVASSLLRQRWIHRSDNFEIARERERDRGQKIARWIIDMWHSAEGHHVGWWPSSMDTHDEKYTKRRSGKAGKWSEDDDGKSDEMSVGFVDWGTNISISTWLTADETDDWQGAAPRHVNTWTGMKKIILPPLLCPKQQKNPQMRTVFKNHRKSLL